MTNFYIAGGRIDASLRLLALTFARPHGYSGQRNPDRLRNDTIAYRVGDGRITDDIEPLSDWDLRRDDGGSPAQAILDDLEQRKTILGVEGKETEIVEYEERRASDAADEALVAAFGALFLEQLEELPAIEVEGPVAQHAGLGAEGLNKIAFTHAGWPGDNYIISGSDPGAVGESHKGVPVEASIGGEVDLGEGSARPKARRAG